MQNKVRKLPLMNARSDTNVGLRRFPPEILRMSEVSMRLKLKVERNGRRAIEITPKEMTLCHVVLQGEFSPQCQIFPLPHPQRKKSDRPPNTKAFLCAVYARGKSMSQEKGYYSISRISRI